MQSNDQIVPPSKTFSRAFFHTFIVSLFAVSSLIYIYLETFMYVDWCSLYQKSPCSLFQKIQYNFPKLKPKAFLLICSMILVLGLVGIYPYYSAILKRRWRQSQPAFPWYISSSLVFCLILILIYFASYALKGETSDSFLYLKACQFFALFSIAIASVHYALLKYALKQQNISQTDIEDELNTQHLLAKKRRKNPASIGN